MGLLRWERPLWERPGGVDNQRGVSPSSLRRCNVNRHFPLLQSMDHQQLTAEDFAEKPFDFLVVGGGTAGLAVAARLSERPGLTVGVLEAGLPATGNRAVDLPGLAGQALGSELDWKFRTVPQPGLGGREAPWARGKVVGGSSALNYMTWNRASKTDYDEWRELGNDGWGWDDLLFVFCFVLSLRNPSLPSAKVAFSRYDPHATIDCWMFGERSTEGSKPAGPTSRKARHSTQHPRKTRKFRHLSRMMASSAPTDPSRLHTQMSSARLTSSGTAH
jgi:choline dehydrogenase-like flavoprotein